MTTGPDRQPAGELARYALNIDPLAAPTHHLALALDRLQQALDRAELPTR